MHSILIEVLDEISPDLAEKVIDGLCAKYEALLQQAYKQPDKDGFKNRRDCSHIQNLFFTARLPIQRLHGVALKVQKENQSCTNTHI